MARRSGYQTPFGSSEIFRQDQVAVRKCRSRLPMGCLGVSCTDSTTPDFDLMLDRFAFVLGGATPDASQVAVRERQGILQTFVPHGARRAAFAIFEPFDPVADFLSGFRVMPFFWEEQFVSGFHV